MLLTGMIFIFPEKNSLVRSHDQVDELERLSDQLMKEHPDFITDDAKKNEW